MLYLFYGSDEGKVRERAFAWVAAARAKEPNVAYARIAREELTGAALEEAAAAGSLFAKRTLVLLDDPFGKARGGSDEGEVDEADASAGARIVDAHLDALAASENVIVLVAPKLPPAKAKKLAAKAAKSYAFDVRVTPSTARGFNSALVNALAARSRERLWLEVVRALRAGDAPEMLHGLLHWKARDLMDLPAGRQEKGVWTPEEARALSLALITLLMDARRKGLDLAASLERFALSL